MSESDKNEKEKKEKKELHWTASVNKEMHPVKIQPVFLTCTPNVEVVSPDPDDPSTVVATVTVVSADTHQFEIQKVYVLQEEGKEINMALCPIHHQAIKVNVAWRSKSSSSQVI